MPYYIDTDNPYYGSSWTFRVDDICTSESASDLSSKIAKIFGSPVKAWETSQCVPGIKKVIFNDPATIVIWEGGTKTVVKCMEGETFDKEKGLAMAICKKLYGDAFHRAFRELCKDK